MSWAHPVKTPAKDKIILPLDVPTGADALALVDKIGDRVGLYKVGLELFTAAGPDLVRQIRSTGAGVFLDLKLHDIPNTVRSAVRSASGLDVQMLTIHLSGGSEMAAAAVEGCLNPNLLILGVTVLTSSNQATLEECGVLATPAEQVLRLAEIAANNRIGGVVASPHELSALRQRFKESLKIVTPGVRPQWAAADDQKRFMTPREAISLGADYLVIGRPILKHNDPLEAIAKIVEELESAPQSKAAV
jgi:orotidine-5'-phosphate decarboxylase